jgi:hypothetical protein
MLLLHYLHEEGVRRHDIDPGGTTKSNVALLQSSHGHISTPQLFALLPML